MPSRAFVVPPPSHVGGRATTRGRSQCPHGHLLFLHIPISIISPMPFNMSQCPHGHLLFLHTSPTTSWRTSWICLNALTGICCSSTYPRPVRSRIRGGCLNALTGICCSSTFNPRVKRNEKKMSQCPHGHLLFLHGSEADRLAAIAG